MYIIQGSITTPEGMGPSYIALPFATSFLLMSFIHSFHKQLLCTTKSESIPDIQNTKILKTK